MSVTAPPLPSHPHTHRQRSMTSMWSCIWTLLPHPSTPSPHTHRQRSMTSMWSCIWALLPHPSHPIPTPIGNVVWRLCGRAYERYCPTPPSHPHTHRQRSMTSMWSCIWALLPHPPSHPHTHRQRSMTSMWSCIWTLLPHPPSHPHTHRQRSMTSMWSCIWALLPHPSHPIPTPIGNVVWRLCGRAYERYCPTPPSHPHTHRQRSMTSMWSCIWTLLPHPPIPSPHPSAT